MKEKINVKTKGNPLPGTEATIYNNYMNENTITTLRGASRIGVFTTTKDKDGFAEIELDKKVFVVYQNNKKLTFTVGTTVEIEDLNI